jgi:hypothetical protein
MLTIFTIPKPFIGHAEIIQRNALQSWLRLVPPCEIFLCGDDQGVKETAAEFNVHHLPNIKKNEFGTPLLNSAFDAVRREASMPLLCYVNADIIITQSLIDAVRRVNFKEYLLIGQRWNLDVQDLIDFDDPSWEKDLFIRLSEEGELQPPFGSDYFIFPKEIDWRLPEFAVGRPGWDNWIIYRARSLHIPVVDATVAGKVIHQNHNYAHIPSGINTQTFEGPEALNNRLLMGSKDTSFNVGDATHWIKNAAVMKAKDYRYLKYRVIRQSVLNSSGGPISRILYKFFQAMLYRRKYFPKWFWQNLIYTFSK